MITALLKKLFNGSTERPDYLNYEKLSRISKDDLDESESYVIKGQNQALKSYIFDAIPSFSKAIELNPSNMTAYIERSKAREAIGDKLGASKDLAIGLKLVQNTEAGLDAYDTGRKVYDESNPKEAIQYFNKAVLLIPTLKSIFYDRGCAKYDLEDYKGAIDDFDRSIKFEADNSAFAYAERARLKSHITNDKAGALEDLNQAIRLNPSNADFYFRRSFLQDVDGAVKDLDSAIALETDIAVYYSTRSLRRRAIKDIQGGIADLTPYINLNPLDEVISLSEAYRQRGDLEFSQGNHLQALSDQDLAIDNDPLNDSAFVSRGIVKTALNKFKDAEADFNTALEINARSADAFYYRGKIKLDLGDEDGGVMDLLRADAIRNS